MRTALFSTTSLFILFAALGAEPMPEGKYVNWDRVALTREVIKLAYSGKSEQRRLAAAVIALYPTVESETRSMIIGMLLHDKAEAVRLEAVSAIASLTPAQSRPLRPAVSELLKDPNEMIRDTAKTVLKDLKR